MAVGFGAVSFGVLYATPGGSAEADVTEVHVPYSDTNFLDVGGLRPRRFEVQLYSETGADFDTLLGLVGTTATFEYPASTTYSGTLLQSLKRTWRTALGHWKADAVFIVP